MKTLEELAERVKVAAATLLRAEGTLQQMKRELAEQEFAVERAQFELREANRTLLERASAGASEAAQPAIHPKVADAIRTWMR